MSKEENNDNVISFRRNGGERPPSEPILNLPPVTQRLCLALILIHTALQLIPMQIAELILTIGGFVPASYTGSAPFDLGAVISPVAHLFLHGGWMHIGMNVAMLMAFGTAIEKIAGARALLGIFFISGLVGALAHFVVFPSSEIPLIGASGAISGLFGAALLIMQRKGYMDGGLQRLWPIVVIWVGTSVFFGFFGMPGVTQPLAWTSHVGGFLAGLFIARQMQK